ncbi:oligosaccharide flippase family protein [Nonlabens sp. Asnod2-A12]|uniref:oligosaccharide flippase family protein n=1 Tax=Nonlabens sp. Asnod2-A12 TaxID=3160578 RepID=UPI003868DBB7
MKFKLTTDHKTVAKNYIYVAILQGLNFILPLLIIPLLEQRIGLEKFGLVMYAQYIMSFCIVITDFGFNITATREIAVLRENKKDYSDFFSSIIWFRMLLLTVMFLLLLVVVFSFDRFREDWLVYLLSYGVVAGQAIFPVWFFQGIEKMQIITIVNVLAKVIFTLCIFFFVTETADYYFVPAFNSLGFLVAGIVSFILALKFTNFKMIIVPKFMFFVRDSFSVTLSNITSISGLISNGLILGYFYGDSIVGVYSIFEKLITASKSVFMPIYQVLYPYISRKSDAVIFKEIKKLAPIIAIVGLILSLTLFIFGEWILLTFFKNNLIEVYIKWFKLMTLVAFTSSLTMLYATLYAPARKLFKRRLQVLSLGAVISIIGSSIFVPKYGIQAAAMIFLISELFMVLLASYLFVYLDKIIFKKD